MRTKRTRHIRKWFITIPRVMIREPGVYQIKVKVSQVLVERVRGIHKSEKELPNFPGVTGEIERGSVDGEEEG